jgi:hypothetical protein
VIGDSKPKAVKARKKEEDKQAKAEDRAAKKLEKELEKKAKAEAKKKATQEKAEALKKKKAAKEAERKKKKERRAAGEWEDEESDDDDSNERTALPWEEWVIMGHAPDEQDPSQLYFHVDMYGHPPEEGAEETWCQRKDLIKDNAQPLIDRYIREKANYKPYSDLLVSKRKANEDVPAPRGLLDKSSPCEHENYRVSFKMEDHPGFCGPGHYLHELKCGGHGCGRTFVPNLKEEKSLGKDKASRPTADKPVYCCVNIEKGADDYRQHVCKYALCNPCWSKAMLGDETGNGTALAGSRRKPMRGV